ncbi:iron-containing alcohol dehydrogenase [Propionicicella superfundia]|uniref:iron-containing alcohol dehydrogenase n=1 Tax=Propionicicella superfundia TaxID=348582 RepID=UPI0004104F6B|nr:iron-containing alcohol dehydrogenase [Propionicicella superfundia]
MPIGKMRVGAGVLQDLPQEIVNGKVGAKGVLIADENIIELVGDQVLESCGSAGIELRPLVLAGPVVPNESAVGRVVCNIPMDTDYLVSIGGGTITDLGRYVGSRLGLPVVSIPSAMTMDGFFTNMSVIIVNEVQNTYYLDYPAVVMADTEVIARCPTFMNAAGVGEVCAKISAGLDWWAANQVKQVYYCDRIADMMGSCIAAGASDATVDGIAVRDPQALADLTDGLYRSAVGMAWYGSSICGSGAEHQLNHFWIMCQDRRGDTQSMHGQAVGAGTVANLMIWDEIMAAGLPDVPGPLPDPGEWEAGVRRAYGQGAADVLALQQGNHVFGREHQMAELRRLRDVADSLRQRYEQTPSATEVAGRLRRAGCPSTPVELGISRQEFVDSVLYAKELRAGRYNSLWMIETLGRAREIAETVADRLGYGSR